MSLDVFVRKFSNSPEKSIAARPQATPREIGSLAGLTRGPENSLALLGLTRTVMKREGNSASVDGAARVENTPVERRFKKRKSMYYLEYIRYYNVLD